MRRKILFRRSFSLRRSARNGPRPGAYPPGRAGAICPRVTGRPRAGTSKLVHCTRLEVRNLTGAAGIAGLVAVGARDGGRTGRTVKMPPAVTRCKGSSLRTVSRLRVIFISWIRRFSFALSSRSSQPRGGVVCPRPAGALIPVYKKSHVSACIPQYYRAIAIYFRWPGACGGSVDARQPLCSARLRSPLLPHRGAVPTVRRARDVLERA